MINTELCLANGVLQVELLLINGKGNQAKGPFLWDTGSTKTTMPWDEVLLLGFSENDILSTPQITIGETATGQMVYGYAVRLPMAIVYKLGTNDQLAEISGLTVYTSKTANLSKLLGTDITSVFDYKWINSNNYVTVGLRLDYADEVCRRARSLEDNTWLGFKIKSLS